MSHHSRVFASPHFLLHRALWCLLVPLALSGAASARAQELHPDWSRVWNRDAQPVAEGTLTVPAGVIVPVILDHQLSSRFARVGDIVTATPISRVAGDSEFPPGTRLGGVVSVAQPAYGATPGVLDVDFQSALLPDGTDVPLHGFIASLDSRSVVDRGGRLIARDTERVNAWQAIGIGGGAGFVLGRLLKTRSLLPTILGATGAYLYARSQGRHGEDAQIAPDTTLGVRLERAVSFPDPDNYTRVRLRYLETHRSVAPDYYGWRPEVSAAPRSYYPDYSVVVERPIWVTVDPFDYYGCPLVPLWSERPRFYEERPQHRDDDDWERDRHREYRPEVRPDERPPIEHFGDGAPFRPSRLGPDVGRHDPVGALPPLEPRRDDRRPFHPTEEPRPRREILVGRPRVDRPMESPRSEPSSPRLQPQPLVRSFPRGLGWLTPRRTAPSEREAKSEHHDHEEGGAPRRTRR